MKNTRWIICFDLETDNSNPEVANPVQLAAVPIHPESLEVKKDQTFNMFVKPPGIDNDEYFTKERLDTIKWHADNYETTTDEIIKKWKEGVDPKIVWKSFVNYCSKYEVDKKPGQWYPQPIPAGYNITDFDLPILRRWNTEFKTKWPLSEVVRLDAEDMMFWWFENLDEPYDFKMDTWRKFLKIESDGTAHDAEGDIYEEAAIVTRFLQFHRRQSSISKFKGSFAGVKI